MKKRMLSLFLALALMLTVLPAALPAAQAADDTEYSWAEMVESMAVRYVVGGAESSRVGVGETFQMEFWINGIDPYAMVLPISWDPTVVTMVNDQTGQAVSSGRKQEADVGDGFRPGASCYDPSYGGDFLPLYWNGKPVYSESEESLEGYPYIDNENGHCRFFYYVDAATPSAGPQLFLTLTFKTLKAGDPNFHFSTSADKVYDQSCENGLTLSYTSEGVVNYDLFIPELSVITDAEQETIVPPRPERGEELMEPLPGQGEETEPQQPAEQLPETDMNDAAHLSCYPYQEPVYAQTVVRTSGSQPAQRSDNYILPASTLAEAINTAVSTGKTAIVAQMPDRIIAKDSYAVTFPCDNLDDLTNRTAAMVYFETPWGFVGVDPAALLKEVSDNSQVTLSTAPVDGGIRLTVRVDGKNKTGFSAPVFRVILPYTAESGTPVVYSSTVFGMAYQKLGKQPLPISRYDAEKQAMIFLTPSAGTYTVETAQAQTFADVLDSYWASEAIDSLSGTGVVNGMGEGNFEPEAQVTRAQMAKMITCALGTYQTQMNSKFKDIASSDWFYAYVSSANAVGIVKGRSETAFDPEANITRQEAAVMAYRGLQLLGCVPEPERQAPKFTDADEIADYAKEAVTALYQAGIINGLPDGSFDPEGTASRAVAAQIISGVYAQLMGLV